MTKEMPHREKQRAGRKVHIYIWNGAMAGDRFIPYKKDPRSLNLVQPRVMC